MRRIEIPLGLRLKWRGIKRSWRGLFNPVCQDPCAILYGTYKGQRIRLVAVVDDNDYTHVVDWIPSPAQKEEIDHPQAPETGAGQASAPVLPAASPAPPSVNPAAIPGL